MRCTESHGTTPEIDTLFIGAVNIDQQSAKKDRSGYAEINTDYVAVKFKYDRGVEPNVLPLGMFKSMRTRPGVEMECTNHCSLQEGSWWHMEG